MTTERVKLIEELKKIRADRLQNGVRYQTADTWEKYDKVCKRIKDAEINGNNSIIIDLNLANQYVRAILVDDGLSVEEIKEPRSCLSGGMTFEVKVKITWNF